MILRIRQFSPLGNLALLSLVLLQYQLAKCIEVAFNKEVCDEHDFYVPYVKAAKTRKGPVINSIYETGLIDLRSHSGLLCINGPAYVYLDFDQSTNTFLKTEPQIFSHGCFGFNRRDLKDYKTGALTPLDSTTIVFGPKIYGVLLIGAPSDYRIPQFQWFRHPQFGFKTPELPEDLIDGSSFGMVVNDGGVYCFEVQSENIIGKLSAKTGTEATFCFREEQEGELFEDIFRKKLTAEQYNWYDCDPNDPDTGEPSIDKTPPGPMPDFRIIDPTLLNPKGSPGKLFTGKTVILPPGTIPFYSMLYPPGYYFQGEEDKSAESSTGIPHLISADSISVHADLTDCEALPTLATPCSDEPDPEKACELLQTVLTIKEVNWNSDKLVKASWRKDILNLITKIYQKVCPQVSKGLSPAVTRVVEYFISVIAEDSNTVQGTPPVTPGQTKFKLLNDPKRPEWDSHLIPDLHRCLTQAEKMPFYRTRDVTNEIRRKEIETLLEKRAHTPSNNNDSDVVNLQKLEDAMQDGHIQFPYHIWLPPPTSWNNKTQIQIREHVEAAEIDYNLDWVIDTFWKIFSTVLGYCNKKYSIRTATFKQLYSYFTEDILDLVVEQWVQDGESYILGNFEKVYDQLFGEFINGVSSRYIDACNDGSYWWADVPDYRPVRPVYLKEGAMQGGSSRPVNFFIEHPLFPSDPDIVNPNQSINQSIVNPE